MQPTPAPARTEPPAALTQQQAAQAFSLWETEYREKPADFLTEAEVRALAVADVSESRAIYFLGLLRQVKQGGAA